MALIDKFRGIFQARETPHRIAMSFSLGVFVGISPLFGLHTIGAFFLAWLLGLNRFIAVTGVYITNPWTIVPIYSFCMWVGAKTVGLKQILPHIDWKNLKFMHLVNELTPLIWPFVVGTVAVGVVGSIASYFIIYGAVIKYKKTKNGA